MMAPKAAKREQPPTEAEVLNEKQFQNPGSAPDAHGEVLAPARSGATVTVACKLGVAFYDIQLSKIVDKFEQNLQGGRMVKEAIRIGNVVRLRGTAYPRGTPPEGFPPPPIIVGGAAMNPGVSKDFWDEWVEQHKLDPLVVNGFIFAHESADHVAGRAKEESGMLSGLEPISPKGDKRIGKPNRSELSAISPAKPGA